ncbi:hypothetical protein [Chryseobacterium sediminis]|uniref:Uncharacterized protein n=1 Tax=Chryseobacterium sediminis TaxID=1679494 RepID=A0A5B2U9M8_9FLAO|nr:hypothetical protein [Chryseobacterium sediminis]KAA2223133.1 hypothetical protein FW780_02705 [Chryseobacterium sediminis]
MNVNPYFLESEDNNSSRHMQGKRRLANYDGCRYDLKDILPMLFEVFQIARERTNDALKQFKPEARSGNLEPNILQSCFAEELFSRFKLQASFGKYFRITLRAKGYIILFKKFSNTGKPMNIKTKNVQNISNQKQTLSLFAMEDSDYQDEPILFFGYKKDRLNQIVDPQLIYLDEGVIRFAIHQSEITIPLTQPKEINKPQLREENKPRIKKSN